MRAVQASDERGTWSLGYGEMTLGGFDRVLHYLICGAPVQLRMRAGCGFVDVGSGYGKLVAHARAAVPGLASCVGVECMPVRVRESRNVACELARCGLVQGVVFEERDATRKRHFGAGTTHIFCFDYVFRPETHRGLVPVFERTRSCLLLVCWLPPAKLRAFGGTSFRLLHKFRGTTTGGQQPVGYIYSRAEYVVGLKTLDDGDDDDDK
jgi:hypothetical protein